MPRKQALARFPAPTWTVFQPIYPPAFNPGGAITDAAEALEQWVSWTCKSNGIPGLTATGGHVDSVDNFGTPTAEDRKRFMKANGMFWWNERCNYYPRGQCGTIQVYHQMMDNTTDPSVGIGSLVDTRATNDKNFESGDGTFFGYPLYVPITQTTDSNYPKSLTTYKLNVHTQSRTASVPRLVEILGNNWAVMSPATANSVSPAIKNGDTVRVTSAQGSIEIEAKVTPKIRTT